MNNFERLLKEAVSHGIIVKEVNMKSRALGLYKNNKIALNKRKLHTIAQKASVLSEELGHHYTTYGNILNQNTIDNRKAELKARNFAYNKLVGLTGIIKAFNSKCKNLYEMAEYLNVTEDFLKAALEYYHNKYGVSVSMDNYDIIFTPCLQVIQKI